MNKNLLSIFISLLFFSGCSSSLKEVNTSSDLVVINPRSAWNALEPKPYSVHLPVRITIHHEGEYFDPDENSAKHIKQTQIWGMGKDRNWSDIPYHFMIDPHGVIYEGRNVYTTGETNTTYDPAGHLLITCIGNFEEQEVTKEQLDALIKLTVYCCEKYQILPETIKAHRDYAETLCPGKNLYKYVENGYIIDEVNKLLNN